MVTPNLFVTFEPKITLFWYFYIEMFVSIYTAKSSISVLFVGYKIVFYKLQYNKKHKNKKIE